MLSLPIGRRMLALVLFPAFFTAAFAHPQSGTLSFSAPELSGSFGVRIESTTQALLGITSVSLKIDGYKFKNKDVGFRYVSGANATFIAALNSGIDVVAGGSGPDFYLVWTPDSEGNYIALYRTPPGRRSFRVQR